MPKMSVSSNAKPTLLGLPVEVRFEILSYLLDADRLPVSIVRGRQRHRFWASVLRTNRQLYVEGWRILRANLFVKVLCYGHDEFAPGRHVPATSVHAVKVRDARIAIAEVAVELQTLHEGIIRADLHMLTLNAFKLYLKHLASRQITWIPSEFNSHQTDSVEEDVWWIRYHISVSIASSSTRFQQAFLQLELLSHSQIINEEREIYASFDGFVYSDNCIEFLHGNLSDLAKATTQKLQNRWPSLESWVKHVWDVISDRKDRADELYMAFGLPLLAGGGELLAELRDICLDLQFFMEACQIYSLETETECLGELRGSILTLLCASFYSYASVYRFHSAEQLDIWPFLPQCNADRCICQALVHTSAHISHSLPSPDVSIPLSLWYRMQHMAILVHFVEQRLGLDLDLEGLLCRLEAIKKDLGTVNVFNDEYLEHDICVTKAAILHEDDALAEAVDDLAGGSSGLFWSRLSLLAKQPLLMDRQGQLRK